MRQSILWAMVLTASAIGRNMPVAVVETKNPDDYTPDLRGRRSYKGGSPYFNFHRNPGTRQRQRRKRERWG